MTAGRPSTYDPAFCERVIAMGNEGASLVEIAHGLGVVKQTIVNWADTHAEFLVAITQAREASQVWWETTGRKGMLTKGIDAGIWSRSMAARFPDDWREKTEQKVDATMNVALTNNDASIL